jgi:hypothetical protein
MGSKRHQLPGARRWPVSPAQIFDVLDVAGAPHPSWVRRSRQHQLPRHAARTRAGNGGPESIAPTSIILTARWTPAGGWGAPWEGGPESVTVSITDLDAAHRRSIEGAVHATVVPELAAWLRWAV